MPTDKMVKTWSDGFGSISEQMKELLIGDRIIALGKAAVETGAVFAKLVGSMEFVMKKAQFAAYVSNGVAEVNEIFRLIALSAHGVSMCAEAKFRFYCSTFWRI